MADMTDDQRTQYATALILNHASDVEYLSIFEMAEEYAPTGECSDDDAAAVSKLIDLATVTVTFPEASR